MALPNLYHLLFGKDHLKDGNVIDLAEHGRSGGVSSGQGFKFTQSVDETVLSDNTTTTSVEYFGFAIPGSDTSDGRADARWKIFKLDETASFKKVYADGNTNYDNVWNSRASLSYS